MGYPATNKQNPKPFAWTAKANAVLAKVARANQVSDATHVVKKVARLFRF